MTEPTDSSTDGVASAGGDRFPQATRPDPQRIEATDTLARIGRCLGAQRVELYRRLTSHMRLDSWWAAAGHVVVHPDLGEAIPLRWFPWTLGNIRQAQHVFVCNAGPLRLRPGLATTVSDLEMGSALHVVVHDGDRPLGAVCAYWSQERSTWNDRLAGHVSDLALDVLGPAR